MRCSVMEALLTAPVGALVAAASRRLPLWPAWAAAAWITGEALRARVPFGGFPWGAVAFSQADGPLLPAASLLSAHRTGFPHRARRVRPGPADPSAGRQPGELAVGRPCRRGRDLLVLPFVLRVDRPGDRAARHRRAHRAPSP